MRHYVPGYLTSIPAKELVLTSDQIGDEFQAWWGRELVWVRRKDLAEALGSPWPFGEDDETPTPKP